MRELTLKTLVNFRVDASVLSAFDNACYLTGSNRTQILRQLISTFTAEAGATLTYMFNARTVSPTSELDLQFPQPVERISV